MKKYEKKFNLEEQENLFICIAFKRKIAFPLTNPTIFKKAVWMLNEQLKYIPKYPNDQYPRNVAWDSYTIVSMKQWNDIPDSMKKAL